MFKDSLYLGSYMKVLLILLMALSFNATAGLQILEVHDFDFTYLNPEGDGTIGKFKFGVDTGAGSKLIANEKKDPGDFLHDINIKIIGRDIFVESDFSYIVWRSAPRFFTDTYKFISRDLELYFTYSKNALTAKRLQYDFQNAKFKLFDFDAYCSDKQRAGGIAQRLLNNCLFNSHLIMSKFNFNFPKKIIKEVVEASHPQQGQVKGAFKIETVRDFKLNIIKSKFESSFTLDWAIALPASVSGMIIPDIEKQVLTIDIDKIKLGKLNVTKLTLLVLKKANIEGLKIEGTKVTIGF
jgi:hypothetical protein